MNQNRTKPAFYSKDENALLVLFIQFLRNAECCIQFEYGSNGKTDNPLITVHRKHQYSRKNQRNGTKDLLPPQSLDDKVLAIIPISHHLYIAEHHRTHCVYKRSKIPTGYLQYCTKQQQPGTCHKYYIIKILNIKISISANFVQTITSEGISSSPLLLLNTKFPQKSKYIEKFKNDIFKNHFRAIVKNSEITTPRISILMQEISTFLKFFDFEENYSSDIIETIIELVTNGASHSESDCLLDIDITNQYMHKENGKKYRGLNICVLDFSTKKLYTDLENKLICDDNIINKYTELKKIYIHHKENFFSTNYNQHDYFFNSNISR